MKTLGVPFLGGKQHTNGIIVKLSVALSPTHFKLNSPKHIRISRQYDKTKQKQAKEQQQQ